jgi:hypothetical protein
MPLLPYSCYMPCPSHPLWLDKSNYTWRTIQVIWTSNLTDTNLKDRPLGRNGRSQSTEVSIGLLCYRWLEVSVHLEGPAPGHLDTGFLGFPLSLSECWDSSQVAAACFSCSPPDLNSSESNFSILKPKQFSLQIMKLISNSENENAAVLVSSHCF